jgi:uncharacterized membrane protein (UPF0127 family)
VLKIAPNHIRIGLVLLAVIALVAVAVSTSSDPKPPPKKSPQPSTAYNSDCGVYRNDKTTTINGALFKTEVTKNKDEFAKGLGGRPCILPDQAMLFSYSQPLRIAIWMKDMKFPLDIIWLSPDHQVVGVEKDVSPSTYPDKFANKDKPAQFVLEIKANRSDEIGLTLGTPVDF